MSADDTQEGGKHYKKGHPSFQHWNLVLVHNWDYFQAQVIKYVMRYKDKGGVEDLRKAQHFIAKMIEMLETQPAIRNKQPLFADFLQHVKPTGWVRFTFEGANEYGFNYTCERCKHKVVCMEFEPPWQYHDAEQCLDGDATPAYVNQDR